MSAAALQDVQSAPLALIGSARAGRRTLLDMLLSARGYQIAVCEDGPTVLEFLKENQPAIAIFDHDLPGMDGREICSRMRFITRLAETPIAIVTPPIDEMGGLNEFESFTDTTTADIVEAEPLGKKKLIERLENVIRDQKGAANDGKMTIAIPTLARRIPEFEPDPAAAQDDELDVFVDDDVDIEVDVARAIYSNDAGFEQLADEEPEVADSVSAHYSAEAEAQAGEYAAEAEFQPDAEAEAVASTDPEVVDEANLPTETIPVEATAPTEEPAAEYGADMFLADEPDVPVEEAGDANDDIDLFTDDGESAAPASVEAEADWPEALVAEEAAQAAHAAAEEESTETEPEVEPLGVSGEPGSESLAAAEESESIDTLVELVSDSDDNSFSKPISMDSVAELVEQPIDEPRAEDIFAVSEADDQSVEAANVTTAQEEMARSANDSEEDDLTATIEAAIEAVNLAAMEEAEYRAAEAALQEKHGGYDPGAVELAEPVDSVDPPATAALSDAGEFEAEPVRPGIEVMPEIAAPAAGLERVETLDAGANIYADGGRGNRIESPSAEADGLEEGDPAVSSGEQYNMQALIAEQAERIDNLQERNVLLRRELEQLKADDAQRFEERSNLQALIKEQTEAITNLQQRNVQLRQELEQFKAEESKRESERTFLQSHTSEQAETIAKLQQLNALLRQELEQRKADEAPLRDFLQRLLDRDEESSAYQEAMRKEIINLTRENS